MSRWPWCLAAAGAEAQTWPDRPVHIVVPLTAGSATDVMARMVAKQLSLQLGQPFIVENKPGAGGTIGTGAVARAKPDGYTLLVQSASYTVTPTTYPNTPYDTQRDLMGVTPLGLLPQALVVAPSAASTRCKSWSRRPRPSPARSTTVRRASARPTSSMPSASASAPASMPCTCRSRARRRR